MFCLIGLSLFQCSEGYFAVTSETGECLAIMFENYLIQYFCLCKHFGVKVAEAVLLLIEYVKTRWYISVMCVRLRQRK
jgi:hypothetical protein